MSYNTSVNAKSAYFSNRPTAVKSGTTFAEFKKMARQVRKDILADMQSMKVESESISKVYRQAVALDKINTMRAEMNEKIRVNKGKLKTALNEVKMAKETALEDFITASPSQDVLNTLTVINMRGSITETELDILTRKCAGNYQSLSLLSSIAEKSGLGFAMPLKAEDISADLDKAVNMCENFIEHIGLEDKNLSYNEYEFFNSSNAIGYTTILLNGLDEDPSTMVSADKPSILQELETARAEAMNRANNAEDIIEETRNLARVTKIDQFVGEHGEELKSDKDKAEEKSKLIAKAETLIGEVD